MSGKNTNIFGQIIGIIVLALTCLLFICPPDQRPFLKEELKEYQINLGLDLKGGSELLYEVNPQDIDPTKTAEDVIGDTIAIISERIHNSGIVKEPRVQREEENKILIQLPGLNKQDTEEIKNVIQKLGALELRLIATEKTGVGNADQRISEAAERSNYDKAKTKSKKALKKYERNLAKKGYRWYASKKGGSARLIWRKDPYGITGQKLSNVQYDGLNQVIHFSLKSGSHKDFEKLTREFKNESLAIIFNNEVMAAPNIADVIPDGSGILKGFSYQDAQELIKSMRSGSLEIQPELLHENTIGPSLGEDSVRLGIKAGMIGLGLVIVFIIIYYLASGVIASIALLLNILIVFAILVIFRETLTLPGIAGLILTVGMSIDANIIIFERIREEKIKRLKGFDENAPINKDKEISKEELCEDIRVGFEQAFSTIFDANLTTFLTAAILYFIASGTVQGFAFTMLWGIVASFFTAIFVTRVLLYFLVNIGLVRKLTMMQALKNPKFEITSKMRIAAVFSLLVVGASLASFFSSSDRIYGLDLRGGVLAQISLNQPLKTDVVRERLRNDFRDDIEVQHVVSDFDTDGADGWHEFAIRLPSLHQDRIDEINGKLRKISDQMRRLGYDLKEEQSRVIEKQQKRDAALKEIRRLRKLSDVDSDLKYQRTLSRDLKASIRDTNEIIKDYSAQVEVVKGERRKLIKEKNAKAGIEELQKQINTHFVNELAPIAFENLQEIPRGKFRDYYSIKVNLRTLLPVSFIEETVFKNKSGFNKIIIALNDYDLTFKTKDSKENLVSDITKYLDLARPSLQPNSFSLEEKDGLFTTTLSFSAAAPMDIVKKAISRAEIEDVNVAPKGMRDNLVNSLTLFIDLPSEKRKAKEGEIKKYIEATLKDYFSSAEYDKKKIHLSEPFPRFSQISGVVAKAQKAKTYRAILLSLILILLYIAARFPNGWRFGFGAVVALVHDIAITLGVIALFSNMGWVNVEINLPVIAALLTIVGYSLNDTIVIFDRLRENQAKEEVWDRLGIKKVTEVFNKSINQTLSRTLLTSLTTLFVVAVIFALNYGRGSVMEGFSFTLIIGIIVGTYSSIFVASATVLRLENRERK